MDALVILIILAPLVAAVLIGIGHLLGWLEGEQHEKVTAEISNWAITLSSLSALLLWIAGGFDKTVGRFELGHWLSSDTLTIQLGFVTAGFNLGLATLFAMLLAIVGNFSIHYLHREEGFHRFFFMLSLFAFAILLLVLSNNAVGSLAGWEIIGFCSYLSIGYFYQRPVAVANATRVLVTNHLGDACFIVGIGLCYAWTGSLNWSEITANVIDLPRSQVIALALCFALAGFVKSAQLPFTPWLARAMEGPTPASAIFYGGLVVHAGVYLVCLLQPLFEYTVFVMAIMAVVGLLTTIYSFLVGLTQTDVKSSLVYAISGQLGLMFLECGLGLWQLAKWHLCAHLIVRVYQLLIAPHFIHTVHDCPVPLLSGKLAQTRWLYTAALQRFWLEQGTDWALVKPVRRLAHDLCYVDDHIIDRLVGTPNPVLQGVSSLAQAKETELGARLDNTADEFAQGSGLAGKLTQWTAGLSNWLEQHFILQGMSKGTVRYGRELGHLANRVERLLLRPRYLVLFVFLTLLTVF